MDRIAVMCITADGSCSCPGRCLYQHRTVTDASCKEEEQNVYPNWTHIAHNLMPAEGTVWSQGPSSRWPDDLKTFLYSHTSSDIPSKERVTHSDK